MTVLCCYLAVFDRYSLFARYMIKAAPKEERLESALYAHIMVFANKDIISTFNVNNKPANTS